ncbi:DExH-box ATP-dependent RNA helicase DExH12-like [Trifolium pratense]|uniref:DExH-box ATP-dependent RNA helicase DExH12-like n=1 Tax=Trifolium pratense TaxID=57577 RepID=UPI001E6956F1|nr:DExH-box ATP-dependent RNA helicase DExH12-like [Trifolium pratense]
MAQSQFNQYFYPRALQLRHSPPSREFPKPKSFTNPFNTIEEDTIVFPVVDDGIYQPKTKKTRAAYDTLLILIQQPLPGQPLAGQPLSTVRFVADKILEILKNDAVNDRDKKIKIEMLLDCIPDYVFDQLVSIGKLITDFYGFADGSHVDGGIVDRVRSMSICSNNGGIVDGVRNLSICNNK